MKKIFYMFSLCFFFVFIFSGCSQINGYMEKWIQERSGIFEEADYIQYQEWEKNGEINQEGFYNIPEYGMDNGVPDTEQTVDKSVHVTFAENSFFVIDYYYDAGFTKPVDTQFCYLAPGESIYAPQPKCNNLYSNNYAFSSFRVFEYDTKGNRGKELGINGDGMLVLSIPSDYQGTEIAVEPVGAYKNKKFALCSYYLDSKGIEQEIFGIWTMNGEDCMGDFIEINPSIKSYTLRYYYDKEEYYYVSSSPQCYFYSNEAGEVEFKEATSFDEYETYSVQLHPYIRAEIECDSNGRKAIKSVKVNSKEREFQNDTIEKLKCGDVVVIETDDEYRVFCSQVVGTTENLANGCRYTIKIPDLNGTVLNLKISKSQLKVVLDKSVENDILFDIAASGYTKRDLFYEKQRFGSSCTVFDASIGTEEEIVISAKENKGTLPEDDMLKISIVKEDNFGGKYEEICYISTLPGKVSIGVYKNGAITSLANVYKKITITISRVKLMVYKQQQILHASLAVRFIDTANPMQLEDGCIADASRRVEVSLIPDEDYYVAGKNVQDNIYSDTMKFSQYSSEIASILEKHPVKKLCHVTLDDYCPFGICVYKVDGEEVSGTVVLKEEQKLVLEYEITDSSYEIVRDGSGFGSVIINWAEGIFSKNKKTVSIPISSDMDGMTIKREDYIMLIEKE